MARIVSVEYAGNRIHLMEEDLYGILEVDRSATLEDIRKAYRVKAKILHPDMPLGNLEQFKALTKAYHVLSDPDLRRNYDATGTVNKDGYEELREAFLGVLASTFEQTIQLAGDEIYRVDIISTMRRGIAQKTGSQKVAIAKTKAKVKHYESLKNRIKRHDEGDNLFTKIIDGQIRLANRAIADAEKEVKVGELCLEELRHYTSEVEMIRSLFPYQSESTFLSWFTDEKET